MMHTTNSELTAIESNAHKILTGAATGSAEAAAVAKNGIIHVAAAEHGRRLDKGLAKEARVLHRAVQPIRRQALNRHGMALVLKKNGAGSYNEQEAPFPHHLSPSHC